MIVLTLPWDSGSEGWRSQSIASDFVEKVGAEGGVLSKWTVRKDKHRAVGTFPEMRSSPILQTQL